MNNKEFLEKLADLLIPIEDEKLKLLDRYYQLLVEWNEKINLTRIITQEEVYLKHFYDSLTLTKSIDLNSITTMCDIGTGAGFPGIVLKIFFPHLKIDLVESLTKKCTFLNEVIKVLELKEIAVINKRAEELNLNEKYDLVTSRAVAQTSILIEYSSKLIKIDGLFIAMKGTMDSEIINYDSYNNELNMKFIKKIEFLLPIENSKRTLIVFKKIKKTPSKYPRRYSEIKKKPL